jgi:hypothetical protein
MNDTEDATLQTACARWTWGEKALALIVVAVFIGMFLGVL